MVASPCHSNGSPCPLTWLLVQFSLSHFAGVMHGLVIIFFALFTLFISAYNLSFHLFITPVMIMNAWFWWGVVTCWHGDARPPLLGFLSSYFTYELLHYLHLYLSYLTIDWVVT